MVLAQKQAYGSMEQNREPRNKPTDQWTINLPQRRQEDAMERRLHHQQVGQERETAIRQAVKPDTRLGHGQNNSKWLKTRQHKAP